MRTLAIFARAPVEGRTKTRLAAGLGDAQALAVYLELVAATCEAAAASATERVEVHFTPTESAASVREMIGRPNWHYIPQIEGDLGARMLAAFESATVIIGTDCPQLCGSLIDNAFRELDDHPLVLGPAEDGGYYLIGARRPDPALFAGVRWSTDQVRARTISNAATLGWSNAQLPMLRDIDTQEDYLAWRA